MHANSQGHQSAKAGAALWHNARLLTMTGEGLGVVEQGCLVTMDGRLAYVGSEDALPGEWKNLPRFDCGGRWITPGLIDCHTHLVHAGNRAREFELRLKGASYEEIAKAGGGIVSSVKALRAASEADLIDETLPRLDALIREGVTTVEIKSGYGLDRENELKSLRAARLLGVIRDVSVVTSFLGAHAFPPEFSDNRQAYLSALINDILPVIHEAGLADAVDGFCEGIAFSPEEIARFFKAAKRLGLPVKLHADQLSNLSGAKLAAEFSALSADHLEYTDEAGAQAMAEAGTVAVILPGAYYFIRETQKPPIDLFRRAGVRMAVATDNNPGTSPLTSLLLTMNMAATLFGLTVEECLAGVTRNAAHALGLAHEIGTLEPGKWADFVVWDIKEPAELVYRMGFNPLKARIRRGIQTRFSQISGETIL